MKSRYITPGEALKLIGAISSPKQKMIARIMYSCGTSVDETMHIRPKDIDFEKLDISVRKTNGKRRHVKMPWLLAEFLLWFITAKKIPKNRYLFINDKTGKKLSNRSPGHYWDRAKGGTIPSCN